MNGTVLWQFFQNLSTSELSALKKFVYSPGHNTRTDVKILFDYLYKARQNASLSIKREAVFAVLFPERDFDAVQMRYVMSFLMQVIKDYLAWTEFEKETIRKRIYLCKALRQRSMDKVFTKEWNATQKLHEKENRINGTHHFTNYLLYQEYYEFSRHKKRTGEMRLQDLSNELSYFFISEILRQAATILTYTIMSPQEFQLPLFREVISTVEKNDFRHVPVVQIYYHSYKALQHPEEAGHYKKLKKMVEQHWQQFPAGEVRNIYLLAINYCIRRWNQGEKAYALELFDWYQTGLQRAVLLEDGQLSRFTYNNILTAGLLADKADWVYNFLKEYKSCLEPAYRENTYKYNMASYYFRQSKYDEAIELLRQVELQDILYDLDARRMLLRIYFELEEFDALDALLDSFATFIRRHKDIGYHRENYLNLVQLMKKIRQTNLKDKEQRKKMISRIEQTKALAEKDWLLGQIRKS